MKKITAVIMVSLLAACSTTQHFTSSLTPSISPPSDSAVIQLAEAARSVSLSLNELKSIEKSSQSPLKPLPYPTSSSLQKTTASVDWSGPIEPLLQRIAKIIDYKIEIIGHKPAIPVLVTISKKNTPLSYIVRDADLQAGTKANLAVYPGIHTIELRYVKN